MSERGARADRALRDGSPRVGEWFEGRDETREIRQHLSNALVQNSDVNLVVEMDQHVPHRGGVFESRRQ